MTNIKFLIACQEGNMQEVVSEIDEIDSNWRQGLYYACRENHIEVAKYLIKIPNTELYTEFINFGLMGACSGGHVEMVELMIINRANDWCEGLNIACREGNVQIAKIMIENGASNINTGLNAACISGKPEMVEYIISQGVSTTVLRNALVNACIEINIPILKLLIMESKLQNGGKCPGLNSGLNSNLIYKENADVINLLITEGACKFSCLMLSRYFKFYNMYCIYSNIKSSEDSRCVTLLQKHPPYVLLVGLVIMKKKNDLRCPIAKLPIEIIRTVFDSF